MRSFFAVCLLVAVCGSTASELDLDARLAELQQKKQEPDIIQAAELLKKEIQDEQTAADEQHAINKAGCDFTTLSDDIATEKAFITLSDSTVEQKTTQMGQISTDIGPLRDAVTAFHDPINQKEAELAAAKKARDEGHAEYERAVAEIVQAVKVIDEIRVFIQNSSVDNAATATSAPSAAVLLEEEAKLHRGLKGQLMRTAAHALVSGSVDSIYEILYKMRNEFKDQLDLKEQNENNAYQLWHAGRVQLRNEIGDLLIDMEKKKQEISAQHTAMAELEADIAQLNVDIAHSRKRLNAHEMALEDKTKLCTDMDHRYSSGTARRQSTLATIDTMIMAINQMMVENADKLATLDAVQSNLDSVPMDISEAENKVLTDEEYANSGAGVVDDAMTDLAPLLSGGSAAPQQPRPTVSQRR